MAGLRGGHRGHRGLKRSRDAVILAHNYQTPEIFHCVADIVGDSLALAREAAKTDADVIVMAGVHFMAETAKLLNPEKTVLIPDLRAGCSLADVDHGRRRARAASALSRRSGRHLRQHHGGGEGGSPISAAPRATRAGSSSRSASPRVIMLPDEYLAANVASQTEVEIIPWNGRCEVHELFTARRRAPVARGPSRRRRARPSRMPARRGRRSRFRRLDGANVGLCRRAQAAGRSCC